MRSKPTARSMLGIGILALVAWASLAGRTITLGQDEPSPRVAKPEDRPWTKTLAGGAVVELISVSAYPAGPKTWFTPSGQPLPTAPLAVPNILMPPEDETRVVEFAVRVKTPPARKVDYLWKFIPPGILPQSSRESSTARVAPDMLRITEELPRNLATCSLRFGVASGPWTTAFAAYSGGAVARDGKPGILFGKARDIQGKTGITVSYKDLDDAVQVVVLDVDGKEHTPSALHTVGVDGFWLLDVEFDVRPARVQAFQFQTRPYEWTTFANLVLYPRNDSGPSRN
jgi:hypothetical protein